MRWGIVCCGALNVLQLNAAILQAQTTSPPTFISRPTLVEPDDIEPPRGFHPAGSCVPTVTHNYVRATQTLSAAFYFPWHRGSDDCPAASDWCKCIWEPKPGNPKPHLGFYDSSDRGVVGAQLDQMKDHGIDVVAVEWTGEAFPTSNFLNSVLPELQNRNMKFVLLYDFNVIFGGPAGLDFDNGSVRDQFVNHISDFASDGRYFRHPLYLKFNNLPVIYLYITRAIYGTPGNISLAFGDAKDRMVANGFPGMYIVADQLFWDPLDVARLNAMGVSAATAFAPVDTREGVQGPRPVRQWADRMAGLYTESRESLIGLGLVDLQPGIFVQYDDRGQERNECVGRDVIQSYNLVDLDDWGYMIDTVAGPNRKVAQRTVTNADCSVEVTTNSEGKAIVWTYSFNEWGEGAGIERLEARTPKYPYGFGLEPLQRLAARVRAESTQLPPSPVPRVPNGPVEGLRPMFTWDSVPSGLEYELRVYDGSHQNVITQSTGQTTYRPPTDLAAGDYAWKVRGRNAIGWGPFSALLEFSLLPQETEPPSAPMALEPEGCISGTRPTFRWSAAVRAVDYKVAIYEVDGDDLIIYQVVSGTAYTPPFDLGASRDHRWKVKSRNSVGETWSESLYFTPGCGGKADIAWYESWNNNGVGILLSNGAGFAFAGQWITGIGTPTYASIGDFDGDAKSDVAWHESWNNGGLTVFLSTGSGFIGGAHWITGLASPSWAGTGDFNGDGTSDVAWFDAASVRISVMLSNGVSFSPPTPWVTGIGSPTWAGVGDFNGDGRSDIAWYEQWNNNGVSVLLSTGYGFTAAGQWANGIGPATWAGVGDFTGDGKADIAWYESWDSGGISVFVSSGSAFAGSGQWASGMLTPTWACSGDFDGDRKADIAWHETPSSGGQDDFVPRIRTLLSTGTTFAPLAIWVGGIGPNNWAGCGNFDGL